MQRVQCNQLSSKWLVDIFKRWWYFGGSTLASTSGRLDIWQQEARSDLLSGKKYIWVHAYLSSQHQRLLCLWAYYTSLGSISDKGWQTSTASIILSAHLFSTFIYGRSFVGVNMRHKNLQTLCPPSQFSLQASYPDPLVPNISPSRPLSKTLSHSSVRDTLHILTLSQSFSIQSR